MKATLNEFIQNSRLKWKRREWKKREWKRTGVSKIGLRAALYGALLAGIQAAQAQGTGDNPLYGSPRGPVAIRDARPYNLLFLQFMPETADVVPARSNVYGLQLDLINNLLVPGVDNSNGRPSAVVHEDNEYQRLMFAWRRGLGQRTELAVYAPLQWRNGGFLDGILSAYHHLAGLQGSGVDNPDGRDHWAEYQSRLELTDATGRVLVSQGSAFGLGETNVTLKHSLLRRGGRSALAVRGGVKLPTGNPALLLGSGSFDVGLSLDARYSLGRDIILYANVGGALMGRATRVPGAQPNMVQTLTALEYRANNRDSFVLQLDGSTRAVRTGNRFADDWNGTATFGYKRVLDRHYILSVSFSENGDIHNYHLPAFSNVGPDITFSAGLEWR